jgi:hypothetical protein
MDKRPIKIWEWSSRAGSQFRCLVSFFFLPLQPKQLKKKIEKNRLFIVSIQWRITLVFGYVFAESLLTRKKMRR